MRARRTQPRSCCLSDCRSPRQAVAFGLGAGLSGPPGAVGTGWDRRARFGLFPRSDRCREHRWSIGNGAFVKYLEARDRAGVFAGHAFERHILELREARPGAARWTSACPTGRRAWLPCLAPRLVRHRPNTAAIRLRPPHDGALRGLCRRRRPHHGRSRQRRPGPRLRGRGRPWPPRDGWIPATPPAPATFATAPPDRHPRHDPPRTPQPHQTSLLTAAGAPVAQINHVGGAPEHPQVRGRAMVEQVHHPEAGTLRRNPAAGPEGRQDGGMLADVVEAALPPSQGHCVRVRDCHRSLTAFLGSP